MELGFRKLINGVKARATQTVNEVTREGVKLTLKDFEPVIKIALIGIGLLMLSGKNDSAGSAPQSIVINNFLYDPKKKED